MIIESLVGRITVTAAEHPDYVTLTSESRDTLISVLDGVELVGGAEGEDRVFTGEDIGHYTLFNRQRYTVELTRAELMRYLEYEVLNFLTYPSLNQMHKTSSHQTLTLTDDDKDTQHAD